MVKNLPANTGDVGLILGPGRLSWRRKWQRTQVILPGESHSLEYYSPLGRKEFDMTYRLNHNNKGKNRELVANHQKVIILGSEARSTDAQSQALTGLHCRAQ